MKPAPNRLATYRALCQLSPEAYWPLARMILSTARAEAGAQQSERTHRRNQRHVARSGNIGKPVVTLTGDDREGA